MHTTNTIFKLAHSVILFFRTIKSVLSLLFEGWGWVKRPLGCNLTLTCKLGSIARVNHQHLEPLVLGALSPAKKPKKTKDEKAVKAPVKQESCTEELTRRVDVSRKAAFDWHLSTFSNWGPLIMRCFVVDTCRFAFSLRLSLSSYCYVCPGEVPQGMYHCVTFQQN